MTYQIAKTVENGIERITYTPEERRYETPILMLHGMWHGAWCWQHWQELLAEWGWESIAFSLPGHGKSPQQRHVRWCTLDYYLKFLKSEIEQMPQRPVLMGHSMGGALTQWYFKHVGDDLPAAVLVAPWVSHSALWDGLIRFLRLDPVGFALNCLTLWAAPFIRTPQRAAKMFITEGALYSPQAFHAKLGPESVWVMMQHNPPLWFPAKNVQTPMLWLAGEKDAVIGVKAEERSAAYYGAEFHAIEGAGHNLMMERSYHETAKLVHNWLAERGIA